MWKSWVVVKLKSKVVLEAVLAALENEGVVMLYHES